MKILKRLLLNNLLLLLAVGAVWADQMDGGNLSIIKDLSGATGSASMASADYSLAFAWG